MAKSIKWAKRGILLSFKKYNPWTSLVAQWLRIHLQMQGTQVRYLVREDPTCHGATKPLCHNYWAHAPQLLKPVRSRARVPQVLSLCAATTEAWALEPVLRNKRSHRNEKPVHHSPHSPQLKKACPQPKKKKCNP